jgi:hypothetical protein
VCLGQVHDAVAALLLPPEALEERCEGASHLQGLSGPPLHRMLPWQGFDQNSLALTCSGCCAAVQDAACAHGCMVLLHRPAC